MTRGSEGVAHYHFPRLWAGRNDERVVEFASGHRFDKAERRRGLRMLIGMMRRERATWTPEVPETIYVVEDFNVLVEFVDEEVPNA